MSTSLSEAQQTTLKVHVASGALEVLNCPSSIPQRAALIAPFLEVRDMEEVDPSDTRDVHPSEQRRHMVPHVFAKNGKEILREVRELCDFGDKDGRIKGNLRWRLFGDAH